jgi:RNA polymerase sigma factor (sigma-70 family)
VTEISDEIIMNRVKEDNLHEVAVLFERYHVKLYNFFLKLTFDKNVSQDLTQNLFYRIIKYRKTYREDYRFKSWVYQMARHVHIDHYKLQKKTTDRFQPVESFNDNLPDNEETYTEDDYERLDRALAQLSPEQQEIIVLSRFQGLKYEEISQIRDMSIAAIKVQVHRAIKQLRNLYFNYQIKE